MHWSTAADQPKSYESCLTVVTLIEGCLRKKNSAKQALIETAFSRLTDGFSVARTKGRDFWRWSARVRRKVLSYNLLMRFERCVAVI